jgi:hypothetical protein
MNIEEAVITFLRALQGQLEDEYFKDNFEDYEYHDMNERIENYIEYFEVRKE